MHSPTLVTIVKVFLFSLPYERRFSNAVAAGGGAYINLRQNLLKSEKSSNASTVAMLLSHY